MRSTVARSSTAIQRQVFRFEPFGAWSAISRHFSTSSRGTGREVSRRRRTARVVVSTSSGVRSSTLHSSTLREGPAYPFPPAADRLGSAQAGERGLAGPAIVGLPARRTHDLVDEEHPARELE